MQDKWKVKPWGEQVAPCGRLHNIRCCNSNKCPEEPIAPIFKRVLDSCCLWWVKRYCSQVVGDGPEHDYEEKIEAPHFLVLPGKTGPPIEDEYEKEKRGQNKMCLIPLPPIYRANRTSENMCDADAEDYRDENSEIFEFTHFLKGHLSSML